MRRDGDVGSLACWARLFGKLGGTWYAVGRCETPGTLGMLGTMSR